jgi:hypothetical protein
LGQLHWNRPARERPRIHDYLGDPVTIPEVDERNPAVIPLAVNPPVEYYLFAFVGLSEAAAGKVTLHFFHRVIVSKKELRD